HDFLLFYFAGHTFPINDDIYFVTSDWQVGTAEARINADSGFYLSMRWLWKVLYQSRGAGKILIILDCCFAGNFIETGKDHFKIDLDKILEKWEKGSDYKTPHNCLRLILSATGYNIEAQELDGHGLMTGLI